MIFRKVAFGNNNLVVMVMNSSTNTNDIILLLLLQFSLIFVIDLFYFLELYIEAREG